MEKIKKLRIVPELLSCFFYRLPNAGDGPFDLVHLVVQSDDVAGFFFDEAINFPACEPVFGVTYGTVCFADFIAEGFPLLVRLNLPPGKRLNADG